MHEFDSVHRAVTRLRETRPVPRKVRIRLGKMRGSARGFEELFREQIRDTELHGIELEIEQVPVEISCSCGLEGHARVMGHVHFVRCPVCGEIADVRKGNELDIEILG